MRDLVEEEIMPNLSEWDAEKKLPQEFIHKMGEKGAICGRVWSSDPDVRAGILASVLGGHWSEYAGDLPVPGGVKPEEWDAFHDFVVVDELSRCGSGGVLWGLIGGLGIGLPPILRFGSEEMKKRVAPDCISGKKRICLAITYVRC